MAKAAPKKAVKPTTKTVKLARHAAAVKPTKAINSKTPAKKPAAVKAPVVSKDELRAQLEKAQATIATLRAKSREATRAAKASAAQIAELEAKAAKLEKKSSAQDKPMSAAPVSEKPMRPRGRRATAKPAPEVLVETAETVPAESGTPEE